MGATNSRLLRLDGRPPSVAYFWLSLVALWRAWCRRALGLSVANHFDEGVREQDPGGTSDQDAGERVLELASRVSLGVRISVCDMLFATGMRSLEGVHIYIAAGRRPGASAWVKLSRMAGFRLRSGQASASEMMTRFEMSCRVSLDRSTHSLWHTNERGLVAARFAVNAPSREVEERGSKTTQEKERKIKEGSSLRWTVFG